MLLLLLQHGHILEPQEVSLSIHKCFQLIMCRNSPKKIENLRRLLAMINTGKNAYALSVLKSMEIKIDGRNIIADNKYVSSIQLANKLFIIKTVNKTHISKCC